MIVPVSVTVPKVMCRRDRGNAESGMMPREIHGYFPLAEMHIYKNNVI